jgi:hypothetical protein
MNNVQRKKEMIQLFSITFFYLFKNIYLLWLFFRRRPNPIVDVDQSFPLVTHFVLFRFIWIYQNKNTSFGSFNLFR